MRSLPPLLVAAALGTALLAPPRSAAQPTLSLAEVVREAKEHNPELRATRQRAQAMAAMPAQARAYDDPTFTYEAWNVPEPFRLNRADNNIFRLSQKIPFPGKRTLAGRIAEHEAEQSSHAVGDVELEVVAAVKRAYYDLWQAHARLAVYARDKQLVERVAHVVEQKYATGDAMQADALRAQVELTHLVNRLQTERLAIDEARAELGALLSRGRDELVGTPEDPRPPSLAGSPDALVDLAFAKRPDLAAQAAAVAREEAAVRLARRDYYPDFEVSLGRFVNTGESDGFGAILSVTLPILNARKYGAGVDEANARLAAARSDQRRMQDQLRRQVEQAFLRARTALLQYDLFVKTHIPQAEQALRVTESGYQTGVVPFLDLVDTLRSIESVHLEHVAAQAAFEQAYADLERVVGAELPRDAGAASTAEKERHE